MAVILPSSPIGSTSPEILRVFRLLKRLPDDAYFVWHRLACWDEPGPDFWVQCRDRRALLLKVSGAAGADLRASVQPQLLPDGDNDAPIGARESAALASFRAGLMVDGGGDAAPPGAILFPHLGHEDLRQVAQQQAPDAPWVGKECLTTATFADWIASHLGPPLTRTAITSLRRAFTPESVIRPTFTVCQPLERRTEAELTGYLFDYHQERLLKTDLDLNDEARATASEFGLRLVNGVAGSGKSLIIVYRAHLLRRLFPQKRILVLTHNRPLIRDLRARYRTLNGPDRHTHWYTFLGWCRRYAPPEADWTEVAPYALRQKLIEAAWHEHLTGTALSPLMLQEEIEWFKDRLLFGREAYLAADRTGRGFALNEGMRGRVYDAMQTYQRALHERELIDWGDVPRRLWHAIQDNQVKMPVYDAILVDEAQFFAPIWFEIIKRLIRPGTGHLFMAADPSQGFLRRRQSWQASGLDVRGRSQHLAKSYRTTREILDFATLLYRTRLPQDDEAGEIVAPNLLDMPRGATPVLIPLTSPQDELTRVVNEIQELIQRGVPRGHILVIHAHWRELEATIARLNAVLGTGAAVNPGMSDAGDAVRVCSLNAATGLEAPIVFLMGLHALYEEEQSVRLSESERADQIRDNTRKLYMACTRAGQRLVLTYVGPVPAQLADLTPAPTP